MLKEKVKNIFKKLFGADTKNFFFNYIFTKNVIQTFLGLLELIYLNAGFCAGGPVGAAAGSVIGGVSC